MRTLFILIFVTLLWSCSSLKIHKASEVSEIKANTIVYQLPQNQLDLIFELEKATFIKGPYSQYAKTYLELEPPQKEDFVSWRISGISLDNTAVLDTNCTYLLTGAIDKILVSNRRELLGLDSNPLVSNELRLFSEPEKILPDYTELTLKKLIIEDSKTSYKTVTVDSISKRIPIVNIVVRNKTTEELAKDAAKTLAKIRKRRFRLIAGMDTNSPQQKSLILMLEELNQKEQQYLELFMGKTIVEKQRFTLSVLPTEYKKYFLFYFDKNKGIVADETKGIPVWLNIDNVSLVPEVDLASKFVDTDKMLPYRIPQRVQLSVEQNQTLIWKAQTYLAQLGRISYVNLDILKTNKLKIDTKTGALIGLE